MGAAELIKSQGKPQVLVVASIYQDAMSMWINSIFLTPQPEIFSNLQIPEVGLFHLSCHFGKIPFLGAHSLPEVDS